MLPQPIHKAPVLDISGDVILLDVDNIVPQWDIYTFSLNVKKPGEKKIVLRVKRDPVKKATVQTQTEHVPEDIRVTVVDVAIQTEDEAVGIKLDENLVPKLELPDPIKLEEQDTHLTDTEQFVSCPIMPCRLLIRSPNATVNDVFPKYMVRPFEMSAIKEEGAIKRANAQADAEEERLRRVKRIHLG